MPYAMWKKTSHVTWNYSAPIAHHMVTWFAGFYPVGLLDQTDQTVGDCSIRTSQFSEVFDWRRMWWCGSSRSGSQQRVRVPGRHETVDIRYSYRISTHTIHTTEDADREDASSATVEHVTILPVSILDSSGDAKMDHSGKLQSRVTHYAV